MNERNVFVAIKGLCVAISVLANRFVDDNPEKWRRGIVQSLKFLILTTVIMSFYVFPKRFQSLKGLILT